MKPLFCFAIAVASFISFAHADDNGAICLLRGNSQSVEILFAQAGHPISLASYDNFPAVINKLTELDQKTCKVNWSEAYEILNQEFDSPIPITHAGDTDATCTLKGDSESVEILFVQAGAQVSFGSYGTFSTVIGKLNQHDQRKTCKVNWPEAYQIMHQEFGTPIP